MHVTKIKKHTVYEVKAYKKWYEVPYNVYRGYDKELRRTKIKRW